MPSAAPTDKRGSDINRSPTNLLGALPITVVNGTLARCSSRVYRVKDDCLLTGYVTGCISHMYPERTLPIPWEIQSENPSTRPGSTAPHVFLKDGSTSIQCL